MMNKVNRKLNFVRDGNQPPTFPILRAAPAHRGRALTLTLLVSLSSIALCGGGCSSAASLAGLSVGLNVAQNGQLAAVSLAAGTNAVAVGVSYAKGTNRYAANLNVPTK